MKRYRITENQVSAEFDKEAVVLQTEAGKYYGLNEVGAFVWSILQKNSASLDELRTAVLDEFDIDEETCNVDVISLLDDLIESKLVDVN